MKAEFMEMIISLFAVLRNKPVPAIEKRKSRVRTKKLIDANLKEKSKEAKEAIKYYYEL